MYETIKGDTFETIARKMYGSETEAKKISTANPGVYEPLIVGLEIIIPEASEALQNQQTQRAEAEYNEVAILLDGKRFRYWNSVEITRAIDSIDTVNFNAPFDSENIEFRKTFQPFTFKKIVITVSGNALFTGTLVNITPNLSSEQETISVDGYSFPGMLQDCTPSVNSLPLEFNNQTLEEIAKKLLLPFGIEVEFQGEEQASFKKVACEPTEKIFSFLTKLAKQKGLLISSTETGKLLFKKATVNSKPVAILKQGKPPLLTASADFYPQEYYSHITGIETTKIGKKGAKYTEKNPHVKTIFRPLIFTASDIKSGELKQAVEAKIGRMFANFVNYNISLPTWRNSEGELWTPNTIISLEAPNAMIYKEYKFLIRSVVLSRDSEKESARLNVVIPNSFNNEIPKELPWDE